jgi:MFS family permease
MRAPVAPRWLHAPDRLDRQALTVLGCLAAMSAVAGYLGTLLTQTITFAATEFHVGKAAQGIGLGVARADVVLSLFLVALADRRGRRSVAVGSLTAGSALTALGAVAPSLPWLVASQVLARGFVTATAIIVGIMAAEAMPAGSRAYAVGLLAIVAGMGAGACVLALPIADVGTAAWRILFCIGLLGAPLSLAVGRRLPESRRFHRWPRPDVTPASRQRLVLLAGASLLFNLFVIPASQFQNEYLRHERHFSAARISLFTVATVLPGAVGIAIGGRLADTHGRRVVGATGLVGGIGATVVAYLTGGWAMWAFAAFASLVGTAVIPALAVYGPELFPTAVRGAMNGIITAAGRVGSVIGLVGVGLLSSALGHFGGAFAIIAVAPGLLVVLVITRFPETAHLELEDLNPQDRGAPAALPPPPS